NRHDACAANQTKRRFDSHQRISIRGTKKRAVGFSSHTYRREIRRDSRAGAGPRSAWPAIETVRIPGLTAASAPAAGRITGTKVRPLAQVCLADDYRARIAQSSRHERVLWRNRPS